MYITFQEYQGMGGKLPETDFIQAEFIARKKINELTFSRLTNETPVRESVKMCTFGLIGRGYCGSPDGKKIKSESLDGALSLTYEFDNEGADEFIRACLSDEPENLFYCGN
jgi:hypothetical protein